MTLQTGKTNYFFDFDGTIADTLPDIRQGYIDVMRAMRLPMDEFERKFRVGPPLAAMVREVLPDADGELCAKMASAFRDRYDRSGFPRTFAYPGVPEMLRRLKGQGKKLFIATNKRAVPTGLLLKKLGMEDVFDGVFCCDSISRLVKKGEMLLLAMERHGLDAGTCVMVGDTAPDIEAGHFAKMSSCAVLWGYGSEAELAAAAPERMLRTPDEL